MEICRSNFPKRTREIVSRFLGDRSTQILNDLAALEVSSAQFQGAAKAIEVDEIRREIEVVSVTRSPEAKLAESPHPGGECQ